MAVDSEHIEIPCPRCNSKSHLVELYWEEIYCNDQVLLRFSCDQNGCYEDFEWVARKPEGGKS